AGDETVADAVTGERAKHGRWAGDKYESDFVLDKAIPDKNGVPRARVAHRNGFPDYSPWSEAEVRIKLSGGHADTDMALTMMRKKYGDSYVNKLLGEGYVVHHDAIKPIRKFSIDGVEYYEAEMQLVPGVLNRNLGHEGTAAHARLLRESQGIADV